MKSNHSFMKPSTYITILVPVLFILTGCQESPAPEASTHTDSGEHNHIVEFTREQYQVADIELGQLTSRPISSSLKVNGIMHAPPQSLVTVSVPFGGFVESTGLLQGMKVTKGQALAEMEDPSYVQLQQDYLDKKHQLEFLEEEFKRQQELFDEKVNAEKSFQLAQSTYQSMLAQVKGLSQKLAFIGIDANQLTAENLSRRITIHSPITGYISAVNVNIGMYVKPADVMFEIINVEHLHAELTVYEKDIMHVKIGQKVMFTLPNDRDHVRLASVYLIGRKINPDRSVVVHAHMEEEDHELLPGMYIKATIELNQHRANTLPEEAVIKSGDKHLIYTFHDSTGTGQDQRFRFQALEVETGATENGYTEVILPESLSPQSLKVIVKGAYALYSQEKLLQQEDNGHGH